MKRPEPALIFLPLTMLVIAYSSVLSFIPKLIETHQ